MLSQDEKNYLSGIPGDKVAKIKPYSSLSERIFSSISSNIKSIFPKLQILHLGSSGLKISGQGDIDIYLLSNSKYFSKYEPYLVKMFGIPISRKPNSIGWKFIRQGYDIELYLTDPISESTFRQIEVFKKLKQDKELLKEYEMLKESMNGKSFRDYQQVKYDFYHRILDES